MLNSLDQVNVELSFGLNGDTLQESRQVSKASVVKKEEQYEWKEWRIRIIIFFFTKCFAFTFRQREKARAEKWGERCDHKSIWIHYAPNTISSKLNKFFAWNSTRARAGEGMRAISSVWNFNPSEFESFKGNLWNRVSIVWLFHARGAKNHQSAFVSHHPWVTQQFPLSDPSMQQSFCIYFVKIYSESLSVMKLVQANKWVAMKQT